MGRERTIERARAAVETLARAGLDIPSFAEELAELLQRFVPHSAACVVTIDPATFLVTSTYKLGSLAGDHALDGEWARIEYGSDDPTRMIEIGRREVPALATSQLPGGSDDSERMRVLVGPAGYHDELRMVARGGGEAWGGVNLFRSSDEPRFDDDDVLTLAALSEQVAEGLRLGLVARCATDLGSETPVGPAVLIVGRDGDLRQMSTGSTDVFDELAIESNRTPTDALIFSLAAAARQIAAGGRLPVPRARLRAPSGRWLVGHAAPLAARDGATGEVVVTIDEARPPEVMPLLAAAFGLSSREREVTQLVLGGSDTKAIASELSMSRYTVQDHLKSIFDKADVRSRRELVARVFFDQYAPRFGDDVSPTGWFASSGADEAALATPPREPGVRGGVSPHHGLSGKRVELVGRAHWLERARALAVDGVGLLFVGEPGVGKTRLLDETLDLLEADGWATERFVASSAARDVPFGPLISLLPTGASDRAQQVSGVRDALTARSGGRPIALAIDDTHLLDEASLACLVELAHHSDVVLIGTARSTEPMPAELTSLWTGEAVARIDVEPLEPADTTELARRLLGGQVSDNLAAQVWDRTHGVPLFVRELLLDAVAHRSLALVDGRWELREGELRTGTRVQELIAVRVAELSEASRDLVEALAVAAPMAVDLLSEGELAELDVLEVQRLAGVELVAGRWMVRLGHPLVGEALAAAMPTRRRVDLLRRAAERLVAAGCPAPGDALSVAGWLGECGDPVPPGVALAAGREALAALALDRACELAEVALDTSPQEGHLLLGEVLRLQGRATEAEAALGVAADLVQDDDTIVQVAMWRSTLRAHHSGDPEGALALLEAAAERVAAPERALELRSEAAFLAGILGRLDVAVDTNRRILAGGGLDAPSRWTAMVNLLFAQVMLADLAGIDEPISAMGEMLDEIAVIRPEGVDLYWALTAAAHTLRGDLDRGEREFVPHVQRCVAEEDLHGVTAAILAHTLLYRGSPDALAIAEAACAATAQSDPFLAGPIAHSAHTLALAFAGDLEGARAALREVDVGRTDDLRLAGFIGRAQAAVLALEGRLDEAAELVAAVGRRCIDGSYVQPGTAAMHDAVRYGRADLVVDDLVGLGSTTAPLIEMMVAHAVACSKGDIAALADVAATMASAGARTLAAEVLDDLARAAPEGRTAARAATSAALWRRAAPSPNALARPVASPLSEAELDVVERAVQGRSTKEIAEQLFVAARTVDRHLAEACRKLEVEGRSWLAEALAPLPPSG